MRILRVLLGCVALAPMYASTGAAANGSIVGRVEVPRAAAVDRRPDVAQLGGALVSNEPAPAAPVVYLEMAPRRAFERTEPHRAVMDQRNETFVPRVLAITAGTTVDFPNSDRIYHNVFSLSRAARFDLGRYAVGRSKSVRFDRAGIVRVFCDIHSHMSAYILVFSHPYFAVADADGRYRIDDVPPGTYSLIAWHQGTTSASRSVTVPDGGSTEIDFTVR
jgi:plastocyanin